MAEHHHVRVLLVDDEETLVEYLSKRLLKEGFTVKAAFNGEQALQAAGGEVFDVAVVDLKMPGIDGIETQKRLHQIQPMLQCIVLTGHGSLESALASGKQAAYQYFVKPIDYEKLVETIKQAAAAKKQLVEDHIQKEIENLATSGQSARGIHKSLAKLRKSYGID